MRSNALAGPYARCGIEMSPAQPMAAKLLGRYLMEQNIAHTRRWNEQRADHAYRYKLLFRVGFHGGSGKESVWNYAISMGWLVNCNSALLTMFQLLPSFSPLLCPSSLSFRLPSLSDTRDRPPLSLRPPSARPFFPPHDCLFTPSCCSAPIPDLCTRPASSFAQRCCA